MILGGIFPYFSSFIFQSISHILHLSRISVCSLSRRKKTNLFIVITDDRLWLLPYVRDYMKIFVVDKEGIHPINKVKSDLAKSLVYGGRMPYPLRYSLVGESGLDVYKNKDPARKLALDIYPTIDFTLGNISALEAYLGALKRHKTLLEKEIVPASRYFDYLIDIDQKCGLISRMSREEEKYHDDYGAFFDYLSRSFEKEDFEVLIKDILPSIELCFAPKISGISGLFSGVADIVLSSGGPRKKSGALNQSYQDAKKNILNFLKKEDLSTDGYDLLFDAFDAGKPKDEQLDFLDIYRQLFIDWGKKTAIMKDRYNSYFEVSGLINIDIANLSEISDYFKDVAFIRDTYLEIKARKANHSKIPELKSKSGKARQKLREIENKISSKKQEYFDSQSGKDSLIEKHDDFYRKLEESGLKRPEIDAIYFFANNHNYDIRDFNDLQTFWRKEIRDKKWWKTVDQKAKEYGYYSAVKDLFSDISGREDAITDAIFRAKEFNELTAEHEVSLHALESRQNAYVSEISVLNEELRNAGTEYSSIVHEIDKIQKSFSDPQLNKNIEKSISLMDKTGVRSVVFPLDAGKFIIKDYRLQRSDLESALRSAAATHK